MFYSIQDGAINAERYIEFLGELIMNRESQLILLADHATFQQSGTWLCGSKSNPIKSILFTQADAGIQARQASLEWH